MAHERSNDGTTQKASMDRRAVVKGVLAAAGLGLGERTRASSRHLLLAMAIGY